MNTNFEIINENYANILRGNNRAIQLTPRSFERVFTKFVRWIKSHQNQKIVSQLENDVRKLEVKKEEYSKSKYMIDQGQVERVQMKIDNIKDKIASLENYPDLIEDIESKQFENKGNKPLRVKQTWKERFQRRYLQITKKIQQLKEKKQNESIKNEEESSDLIASLSNIVESAQKNMEVNHPIENENKMQLEKEQEEARLTAFIEKKLQEINSSSVPRITDKQMEMYQEEKAETRQFSFDSIHSIEEMKKILENITEQEKSVSEEEKLASKESENLDKTKENLEKEQQESKQVEQKMINKFIEEARKKQESIQGKHEKIGRVRESNKEKEKENRQKQSEIEASKEKIAAIEAMLNSLESTEIEEERSIKIA